MYFVLQYFMLTVDIEILTWHVNITCEHWLKTRDTQNRVAEWLQHWAKLCCVACKRLRSILKFQWFKFCYDHCRLEFFMVAELRLKSWGLLIEDLLQSRIVQRTLFSWVSRLLGSCSDCWRTGEAHYKPIAWKPACTDFESRGLPKSDWTGSLVGLTTVCSHTPLTVDRHADFIALQTSCLHQQFLIVQSRVRGTDCTCHEDSHWRTCTVTSCEMFVIGVCLPGVYDCRDTVDVCTFVCRTFWVVL